LGRHFGALGVVSAWVGSLIVCSGFISIGYHVRYGISLSRLMPRSSIVLTVVCLFGIAFTYLVLPQFPKSVRGYNAYLANYAFLSLAILALLWIHPSRKQLFRLIMDRAG